MEGLLQARTGTLAIHLVGTQALPNLTSTKHLQHEQTVQTRIHKDTVGVQRRALSSLVRRTDWLPDR